MEGIGHASYTFKTDVGEMIQKFYLNLHFISSKLQCVFAVRKKLSRVHII